jgi:hypothetical protein
LGSIFRSALYSNKASTNLHIDMSDAVNLLVYVSSPIDGNRKEDTKEVFKEIDLAGNLFSYIFMDCSPANCGERLGLDVRPLTVGPSLVEDGSYHQDYLTRSCSSGRHAPFSRPLN